MKNFFTKNLWILITIVVVALLIHQCTKKTEPKIVTKTEIVTKIVHDTIVETKIEKVKEPVYVERIKTLQGKDSIIYRDKPTENTVEANLYNTNLKSNNAEALLKITALGEVLDVKGVITYPEVTKTITNDIYHEKGGLFLYGQGQIDKNPQIFGLGLDWVIKNKYVIGVSANHDNINKNSYGMVKLGIKLF